jgi:hypothetical protein
LGDPEVCRLVEKGKEFGPPSGSYVFAADVVVKHDNPAPRDGTVHLICVYNVPPHVSSRKLEHDQKFEESIENYLAIPKVKKNVVRLEMVGIYRPFSFCGFGQTLIINNYNLYNMDFFSGSTITCWTTIFGYWATPRLGLYLYITPSLRYVHFRFISLAVDAQRLVELGQCLGGIDAPFSFLIVYIHLI